MTGNTASLAGSSARLELPRNLLLGASIVLIWCIAAVLAPWIAPHDPNAIAIAQGLEPPGPGFWFGTDHVGRDVFSRVLHSARIDLLMCLFGVVPALLIGTTIGLVSGYYGGVFDTLLMRVYDITVAFPFFVLILAIVGALGPGLDNYFIALALVGWVSYARLVRAEVLVIKNADYALAARTLGFTDRVVLTRHVLPNALYPVISYAMTDAVLVILAGASLGFLGMGAQPPTAEWGVMIAEGQTFVDRAWWICFFPGLATISLGLGLVLLGDGVAQARRALP